MKSLERKNKLIYILIIIFLIIISTLYYIKLTSPLAMKKYDVSFEVTDGIGFDLNSTSLKFGRVFPGSESSKELNVQNNYDFPIKIELSASDNLAKMVYLREPVYLEPHQTKSFIVYLYVPNDYPKGNYSGEVVVSFLKN